MKHTKSLLLTLTALIVVNVVQFLADRNLTAKDLSEILFSIVNKIV